MRYKIQDIQFEPTPGQSDGLLGFASFVFNHVQWNGLAVFSRLEGGVRVAWPERQRGIKRIKSAKPLSPKACEFVDQAISEAIKAEKQNEVL